MNDRRITIPIVLNGKPARLAASAATQTLLQALSAAGYHGSKEGCGDGDCGACTVNILQSDAQGQTRALAVNSCLIPIGQLSGAHIVTVEGVQQLCAGALHPVQAAMVQHAGSQCGYCTPGFVMSLVAVFHDANPRFDDASIEGNLCRCTGYNAIRRAMRCAAAQPQFALPALSAPAESAPANAEPWLYRPETLAQALQLKCAQPQAQWLAGATDLGLEFSRCAQHPNVLISLDQLAELRTFERVGEQLHLGAGLPLMRLEQSLQGDVGAGSNDPSLQDEADGILRGLRSMLHVFAAKQVRNRATIGGNFGTASPIGDLLPVFLALDARLNLASARGMREVPIAEYFLSYRQTALSPDELLHSVQVPLAANHPDCARRFSQSYKVGKRGSDDISIVAACFVLELDADARIVHARLAYGGIAAVPIRACQSEALLVGQCLGIELVDKIATTLGQEFTPLSDFRGSSNYRRRLIVNLFAKFVSECMQ